MSSCATNAFYRTKLAGLSNFEDFPLTTRADLEHDQISNPPHGTNLTYPLDNIPASTKPPAPAAGRCGGWTPPRGGRGSSGCWGTIFAAAGIDRTDRVLFPFSFGPFLGFWAAFESAVELGLLAIPAGGLSTTRG